MFQNNFLLVTIFVNCLQLSSCSNHDFSTQNLNIINDGPSNACSNQPETAWIGYVKFFFAGFCGFILLYIFVRLAYFGESQLGFKKREDNESGSFLNVLMGEPIFIAERNESIYFNSHICRN